MLDRTITTSLAFVKNAEEAVTLYVNLFSKVFGKEKGESKIIKTTYFGKEELEGLDNVDEVPEDSLPGPIGAVRTIRFLLRGQEFVAVNGGGFFGKFHESMSLYVECKSQKEIDQLFETLSVDAELQPCGWIKDRFGLSWQIVPDWLWSVDEGDDRARAQRIMKQLYQMNKIDMEKLAKA